MVLSQQDRVEICDLVSLHGHLTDAGELGLFGEVFTDDVVYDVGDFGLGALHGVAAVREAALALGEANPVGHHVTNVVVTGIDGRSARVRSKGVGVRADGTAGSVVYDDVVTRVGGGWRISYRKVTVRRVALGGVGAREVLGRWRDAAVGQSVDGMRRVYAVDAVHEFPFTRPGLPSRLEGREAIVGWVAAMWRDNAFTYSHYRTLAVHDTRDPGTIVVEQEAHGTSVVTGEFVLPNIVVLTVRDGQIVQLRDYVNLSAAADVVGRAL